MTHHRRRSPRCTVGQTARRQERRLDSSRRDFRPPGDPLPLARRSRLGAEQDRFALPFEREPPTQGELRVAQAQLVGWLEGLFHGIQFALFVQQMAARSQLEELRRHAGQAAGREPVSSSGPYL